MSITNQPSSLPYEGGEDPFAGQRSTPPQPLDDKQCPNCGLWNFGDTGECSCGYSFVTGLAGAAPHPPQAAPLQAAQGGVFPRGWTAPQKAVEKASAVRRFFNFFLDTLFIYLGLAGVGLFIGLFAPQFVDDLQELSANACASWLVGWGIMFLYYFLTEWMFQRTFGKLITGTKVVTEDGRRPGMGDIFTRTLVRFVPFEVFSISKETWWHDRWSRTRVVRSGW